MTEDHCNRLKRALPSCDKMSQSLLFFEKKKFLKNYFRKKIEKKLFAPFFEHIKKRVANQNDGRDFLHCS